jgi:hypothetical protein
LMKSETEPEFEYVLTEIRKAVGEEAWSRMTCVATDGCAAMTAALRKVAPHAMQQRCVWHLQQNIKKNTGGASKLLVQRWYKCVGAATEEAFEKEWTAVIQSAKPGARTYLEKNILPLKEKWASYCTNHFTNFGSNTTQLVESLNRLLKRRDLNDRATLNAVIQRLCTVTEEREKKKEVAEMYDATLRAIQASSSAKMDYRQRVTYFLTSAAAKLCTEEYLSQAQYLATPMKVPRGSPFSLETKTFMVEHKQESADRYQVHVSPTLIYCECGYCFAHLLPCRHVLAANSKLFDDTFQPGQYHPRWVANFDPTMMANALEKQFWINIKWQTRENEEEEEEEKKSEESNDDSAMTDIPSSSSSPSPFSACPPLPSPTYDSGMMQQFLPVRRSPQEIYHLVHGATQQFEQLATSNPILLMQHAWGIIQSGVAALQAVLDHEERRQQSGDASTTTIGSFPPHLALNSQGLPLTSMLAPVPITAKKLGRPSNKRSRAALEGVASKKIRTMWPIAALAPSPSESSSSSSSSPPEVESENCQVQPPNPRRREARPPKRLGEEEEEE